MRTPPRESLVDSSPPLTHVKQAAVETAQLHARHDAADIDRDSSPPDFRWLIRRWIERIPVNID